MRSSWKKVNFSKKAFVHKRYKTLATLFYIVHISCIRETRWLGDQNINWMELEFSTCWNVEFLFKYVNEFAKKVYFST